MLHRTKQVRIFSLQALWPPRETKTKLEICTNHDDNTVVQGLVSIPVNSYEDVLEAWCEALVQLSAHVAKQDVKLVEEH